MRACHGGMSGWHAPELQAKGVVSALSAFGAITGVIVLSIILLLANYVAQANLGILSSTSATTALLELLSLVPAWILTHSFMLRFFSSRSWAPGIVLAGFLTLVSLFIAASAGTLSAIVLGYNTDSSIYFFTLGISALICFGFTLAIIAKAVARGR